MPVNTPEEVTTTFITQIADGGFSEANEEVHSDGPFEGDLEFFTFLAMVFTGFTLPLLLPNVSTEVAEMTVVEQGPQSATVHADVSVTDILDVEVEIEARTEKVDASEAPSPAEKWQIWDVGLSV